MRDLGRRVEQAEAAVRDLAYRAGVLERELAAIRALARAAERGTDTAPAGDADRPADQLPLGQ